MFTAYILLLYLSISATNGYPRFPVMYRSSGWDESWPNSKPPYPLSLWPDCPNNNPGPGEPSNKYPLCPDRPHSSPEWEGGTPLCPNHPVSNPDYPGEIDPDYSDGPICPDHSNPKPPPGQGRPWCPDRPDLPPEVFPNWRNFLPSPRQNDRRSNISPRFIRQNGQLRYNPPQALFYPLKPQKVNNYGYQTT